MADSIEVTQWLTVSRETMVRLETLGELVQHWSARINLVSKASLQDLWHRHILDSAQIFSLGPIRCDHWVDIGSGGGFPGIVIAILAEELSPSTKVTLVESDKRKAVFLREAARQLGLSARVIGERIEKLPSLSANALSARALAPLAKLCDYANLHLGEEGIGLFPKGENYESEVEEAHRDWTFSHKTHPSRTDPSAVIIELKDLKHV